MSMIMEIYMLSDSNIERLLANPETIEEVMTSLCESGRLPEGMSLQEPEGTLLDLDKAWHGVHFLLAESTWEGEPPYDFLLGGNTVGDIDIGYGPARVHRAADVRAFYESVNEVAPAMLRSRFDPETFKAEEIYPSIWDDQQEADWLIEKAEELKAFAAACRDANMGCLIALV